MEDILSRRRIESIDIARGIIIVLMGLDHVRDYFSYTINPTDLETTTPAWFFTRWITHFCAPGFVFLAGLSAFLYGKKVSRQQLALFLISRGFWLILMEFTLVHLGWTLSLTQTFFVQVIWVIGWSMIILAGLIFLNKRIVLVFSVVIIASHNALDRVQLDGILWNFMHVPFFDFSSTPVAIAYPIVPWPAIMALGYALGDFFFLDESKRRSRLLWTGLTVTILFIVLRSINGYGDPTPRITTGRGLVYDVLSFLNTQKYPPSLMYTCMTLGPLLMLLSILEEVRGPIVRFFDIFGKVPFFFYIVHLYFIHFMSILFHGILYDDWGRRFFTPPPQGFTSRLWLTYLFWGILLIGMYFLCRWFGRIKKTYHYWWLKYL